MSYGPYSSCVWLQILNSSSSPFSTFMCVPPCSDNSSVAANPNSQYPRMPLRFVVQAMFVEQLNTRRSVFSAAKTFKTQHQLPKQPTAATLGAILQHNAALRQVAHLKATMDYTSNCIQSLEQELKGMRKILTRSEMG
ncbi:hypothetical protein L1887_37472 [Cichorium endivia]|nr:hypothetical protein L1887_37472 [Cichorium endivia]